MGEPVRIHHEAVNNAAFDLQSYVQEKIIKEFNHNLWQSIENIMRTYIDNPIEGELTKEKIRDANIMGIIHQEEPFPPKVDVSPKGVNLTLTSDILGVRQGDTLITHEGKRMPVSEIPVPWYEERFIYD
jgi:hypothetical protein